MYPFTHIRPIFFHLRSLLIQLWIFYSCVPSSASYGATTSSSILSSISSPRRPLKFPFLSPRILRISYPGSLVGFFIFHVLLKLLRIIVGSCSAALKFYSFPLRSVCNRCSICSSSLFPLKFSWFSFSVFSRSAEISIWS